jgi:DNA polymerase IV
VEMHRRPELRGRPIVVGGDPSGRGVVATANYAARRFGIRSAMSSAEARRRCPEVVFVRPDMAEYQAWSARVWDVVRELVPATEMVGIDEGYLDLGDDDPVTRAREVQAAVAQRVRLSCSLGVASCKVVAKIASDREKPGGLVVVPAGEEAQFLAPLPLRDLPGAGPRTVERLNAVGVHKIGELAALNSEQRLAVLPGQMGTLLIARANGIDPRRVETEPVERVSISTENTFARDITDRTELDAHGSQMAREVAASLGRRERYARTVVVKLRYADFSTITRSQTLTAPTADPGAIWRIARRLLDDALRQRPDAVRLLGVGASGLSNDGQLVLFPDDAFASEARAART